MLGIPTYGRSYTLANPDAHEISSPAIAPGEKGSGTKEDGYLAYYEICQKVLEEGLARFPDHPILLTGLGSLLIEMRQLNDAVSRLEKALQVDPDLAAAWFNLAIAFEEQALPEQAIKAWKEGLKRNPTNRAAASRLQRLEQ